MGLLSGEIAGLFGTVFGGIYLPGVLTRLTLMSDGEGGGTMAYDNQLCRVQIDQCTQRQQAEDDYSVTDMRLLVLQSGVTGGPLTNQCMVLVSEGPYAGVEWSIASVVTDPASSYWECRGQRTNGAAG